MTASPTPLTLEHGWPEQGQWTYEDWARLPDDGWRYEVIDGVLFMAPAPGLAHQRSSYRLTRAIGDYVDKNALGEVLYAPTDVRLPDQPVPLQPDILFIRAERSHIIETHRIEGVPDLVVEILSPSNWAYDRREKLAVYQEAGVPEYWIVDPRAKTIEVFVLEEEEYALLGKWGEEEIATSRVIPGFNVRAADVFPGL
jgi:Uma2 family endonuclease